MLSAQCGDAPHRRTKSSIGLCTVNSWGPDNGDDSAKVTLLRAIMAHEPDFVAIQEAPLAVILEKAIVGSDYRIAYYIDSVGGRVIKYEIMAALVKSSWTITRNELVCSTIPYLTKRTACITTLERGDERFTIANVHLCGGLVDEQILGRMSAANRGAGEELRLPEASAASKVVEAKNEILREVLETRPAPDVVMGDFNSDLNSYIQPDATERLQIIQRYFRERAFWDDNVQILMYMKAPFQLMEYRHYLPAWHSGMHESHVHGQTPDSIWYHPKAVRGIDTLEILPYHEMASDHKAIVTRLSRHA